MSSPETYETIEKKLKEFKDDVYEDTDDGDIFVLKNTEFSDFIDNTDDINDITQAVKFKYEE